MSADKASDRGDTDARDETDAGATEATPRPDPSPEGVRRFALLVVEGEHKGAAWESASDHCSIGSHLSNDLVIEDPTVSRFHCEILVDSRGARVRDLESRNGTILDGISVIEAFLRGGSLLRLGRSIVRFQFGAEKNRLLLSERSEFGSLVGVSTAMRSSFAFLERAAATDATVLLEGETGTGKEGAAESIHLASARREQPFITIDCSAIPENLIESELFGHERGSFTGATGRRTGAFEEAHGGTIFLDEIGELPADLQPKLLRVLEQREIRRVGSNVHMPVDVRVIAATNRDLRAEVNAGRFRSDVYFRLAVVKIAMPPLRRRPEDIPVLVKRILGALHASPDAIEKLTTQEFLGSLQRAAWPGNVRELRNYLERCLVFQEALPIGDGAAAPEASGAVDASMSYDEARRRALNEFECRYVDAVLRAHRGKVAPAARAAGIDRVYLYRLMRRHHIKT